MKKIIKKHKKFGKNVKNKWVKAALNDQKLYGKCEKFCQNSSTSSKKTLKIIKIWVKNHQLGKKLREIRKKYRKLIKHTKKLKKVSKSWPKIWRNIVKNYQKFWFYVNDN